MQIGSIRTAVTTAVAILVVASTLNGQIGGQPPGGGRGRAGGAPPPQANLPSQPPAVALPSVSAEVTGPGPMFDSSPSLSPPRGSTHSVTTPTST
jgi:hypothetical protein